MVSLFQNIVDRFTGQTAKAELERELIENFPKVLQDLILRYGSESAARKEIRQLDNDLFMKVRVQKDRLDRLKESSLKKAKLSMGVINSYFNGAKLLLPDGNSTPALLPNGAEPKTSAERFRVAINIILLIIRPILAEIDEVVTSLTVMAPLVNHPAGVPLTGKANAIVLLNNLKNDWLSVEQKLVSASNRLEFFTFEKPSLIFQSASDREPWFVIVDGKRATGNFFVSESKVYDAKLDAVSDILGDDLRAVIAHQK